MIIGVTGSLSTGTSTAARYIAEYLNGHLIEADRLARDILKKSRFVCNKVVSEFGKDILNRAGAIDRERLAKKAFSNKRSLRQLCDIIHPVVIDNIKRQIKKIYSKDRYALIIVDGPVLIESKFYRYCDCLILIKSLLALQLERAKKYKNFTRKDALRRVGLQMPLSKKALYADYIIANNADLTELKDRCKKIARDLIKNAGVSKRIRH